MVGKFEDINANVNSDEFDNGDYYFYVSNKLAMTVAKNSLTDVDILKEPDALSVISSILTTEPGKEIFITGDDSYFATSDNKYYKTVDKDESENEE